MRISIEQLREYGYNFALSKNDDYIEFYPTGNMDKALRDNVIDIAGRLGFNEVETDQFISLTYRLQVMSVLRRCSGW